MPLKKEQKEMHVLFLYKGCPSENSVCVCVCVCARARFCVAQSLDQTLF